MMNNNLINESYKKSNTLLEQYSSVYSSGGCLSQLLEHFQLVLQGLEKAFDFFVKKNLGLTKNLDFCKAFDKVDHKVLLETL